MFVEMTIRAIVKLNEEDAEKLESGEMLESDIDWSYYADAADDIELVDITTY